MEISASAGMHGRRAIQWSRIMSVTTPAREIRHRHVEAFIYAWVIRGIKRPVRNRRLNHNPKVLLLHYFIPGPTLFATLRTTTCKRSYRLSARLHTFSEQHLLRLLSFLSPPRAPHPVTYTPHQNAVTHPATSPVSRRSHSETPVNSLYSSNRCSSH